MTPKKQRGKWERALTASPPAHDMSVIKADCKADDVDDDDECFSIYSDTDIMKVARKNPSNLFLIKSYSFMDQTHTKRYKEKHQNNNNNNNNEKNQLMQNVENKKNLAQHDLEKSASKTKNAFARRWQSIRRSFGAASKKYIAASSANSSVPTSTSNITCVNKTNKKSIQSDNVNRSSSSVSTLAFTTTDTSMAPLQSNVKEVRSAACLNHQNNNHTQELRREESSPIKSAENDNKLPRKNETKSFISFINRDSSSTRSNSPVVSKTKSDKEKCERRQISSSTSNITTMSSLSDKKEKKRKDVMSSSRIKKFHRHFPQICKDEKLINYFSCALVSDILLQGHLYITDTHFAFYSNVFGYVTKLVIPTSSVTRVSKEKTAKIIPNAVGVATVDERHVFGSFISRESAFRLMCSVCPQMAPAELVVPAAPADGEVFEEFFNEDDSSCSVSGNESLPVMFTANADTTNNILLKRTVTNKDSNNKDIPKNAKSSPSSAVASSQSSTNSGVAAADLTTPLFIVAGSGSSSTTSLASTPTPSSSSVPTTVATGNQTQRPTAADNAFKLFQNLAKQIGLRLKIPSDAQIVYLGVLLTIVLAMFSIFLLYRIMDIETKANVYHSSNDFDWRAGNKDDILKEALRWQKHLQKKSAEEAQQILNTNLEQIGKVRRSLETLSMLIQERNSNQKESD